MNKFPYISLHSTYEWNMYKIRFEKLSQTKAVQSGLCSKESEPHKELKNLLNMCSSIHLIKFTSSYSRRQQLKPLLIRNFWWCKYGTRQQVKWFTIPNSRFFFQALPQLPCCQQTTCCLLQVLLFLLQNTDLLFYHLHPETVIMQHFTFFCFQTKHYKPFKCSV